MLIAFFPSEDEATLANMLVFSPHLLNERGHYTGTVKHRSSPFAVHLEELGFIIHALRIWMQR
jgi:hypothetical protein